MVASLNANWLTEFSRRDVRPVCLFDFEFKKASGGALETFKWCSGPTTLYGYDPCVSLPEAVGVEIDPITREVSVEEMDIEILRRSGDGTLRDVLDTHFVKGKKVIIKLGTPNLAEGDFITLGRYLVDRLRPSPFNFKLTLSNAGLASLRDAKFQKATWVNRHPLKAIRMILEGADGYFIPPDTYDSDSIDPSTAANSAISHYVTTRSFSQRIATVPEVLPSPDDTVGTLIGQLVEMVQGTWAPRVTDGKMAFKPYSKSRAVDRTWTVDDRDIVAPEDVWDSAVTEVSIRVAKNIDNDQYRVTVGDATIRTNLGYSGQKASLRHDVECWWANGIGVLRTSIADADGAGVTVRIIEAQPNGMTGTGTSDDNVSPLYATIPAWAELTDTNTAFFMFVSQSAQYQTGKIEIIEFDRSTRITTANPVAKHELAASGHMRTRYCAYYYDFRIKTRNARNIVDKDGTVVSSKQTWAGQDQSVIQNVVDVTAVVRWADAVLSRAAYGSPRLEVRTWFDQMDVEIGDFISADNTSMVPLQPTATVASQVWEVIGKKVVLTGDSPGIHWKLAFVRETPNVTPVFSIIVDEPLGTSLRVGGLIAGDGRRVRGSTAADEGVYSRRR